MISSSIESGPAAHTVPPTHSALDEQFTMHLREHVQQLQLIQPVISVAVMALHRCAAEADCDIALVLDHHASAPLFFEIARLEAALASFEARRPQQVAA
jgi:hypothetical protein